MEKADGTKGCTVTSGIGPNPISSVQFASVAEKLRSPLSDVATSGSVITDTLTAIAKTKSLRFMVALSSLSKFHAPPFRQAASMWVTL